MIKMDKKSEIKKYWENRLPQMWYSTKTFGTKKYFDELNFLGIIMRIRIYLKRPSL